ncbi:hypothetical protein ACROYT_G017539 [Oculina patagonica]
MRWPPRLILLSIFLQWLILLPVSRAMLNGFTTVVEAGKVNCFYENIDNNRTLEMEYQVVEGGGEMDIIFQVISPNGALLVNDEKKTDEVHTLQAAENGVYAFCFDNSFSTLAEKIVYVDLGLENDELDNWLTTLQGDTGLEEQELQVESIRAILDNIRLQMEKAQGDQTYLTKKNFKNHFVVTRSGNRVFWWSLIQSVALIGVAICQVLIVKNFFGTGSGQKI